MIIVDRLHSHLWTKCSCLELTEATISQNQDNHQVSSFLVFSNRLSLPGLGSQTLICDAVAAFPHPVYVGSCQKQALGDLAD